MVPGKFGRGVTPFIARYSRALPPMVVSFRPRFEHKLVRVDSVGSHIRGSHMKSAVLKRSIVIGGHKTSVSIEDAFWNGLKEIALGRKLTLSKLVDAIDSQRSHSNLSSAIRLFVLDHYRTMIGSVVSTRPSVDGVAAHIGRLS